MNIHSLMIWRVEGRIFFFTNVFFLSFFLFLIVRISVFVDVCSMKNVLSFVKQREKELVVGNLNGFEVFFSLAVGEA